MTRYHWPSVRGGSRDNAAARAAFVRSYRSTGTQEVHEQAMRTRRAALAAGPAGLAPGTDDTGMWVPVGPSTVVGGQARFTPRISGRVRDIAVSPDGDRVYAATAGGGVWYSGDAGTSWLPVGAWASAVRAEVTTRSNLLSTGCLLVQWGGTAADDTVYVGTGEIEPSAGAHPGGQLGGVGVLFAHGPVAQSLADPLGNPWQREGKNMRGFGIYRLATDPDNPDRIVAATSHGLYTRFGGPVSDSDWDPVCVPPFDEAEPNLRLTKFRCTDVAWSEERISIPPISARLYVCVNDTREAFADNDSGLWVSESGVLGPFRFVNLPGSEFDSRFGIAQAPGDERVLYVLGKGPRLWRVQAQSDDVDDIAAHEVDRVPAHLFNRDNDQSHYDLALAVDPDDADRIAFGGATVLAGNQHNAALFRCAVEPDGGDFKLAYGVDEKDDKRDKTLQAADDAFIGEGIHADVHQIVWQRAGARRDMWIACDGGVFRSRARGDRGSFISRNTGIAALEAGYVAGHPTNDVAMLAGTQDNGVLTRIGDTLWETKLTGDGGGVAYHPRNPSLLVGQYTGALWRDQNDAFLPMVKRSPGNELTDSETTEDEGSVFYSGVTVRAVPAGPVRLAIGTIRVWLSDDFGTTWTTLPSNEDPRRGGRENWRDDVPFLPIINPPPSAAVIALRWIDDERLLVLCQGAVFLFDHDASRDEPWQRTLVDRYNGPSCGTLGPEEVTSPAAHLMPIGRWSDIASHAAGAGTMGCGTFYVTTTGPPKGDSVAQAPNADALWWFDGTDKWYPTGLRSAANGVAAPAYAVVVDPWNNEFVYVGTSVGVWRGQFDDGPDGPTWDWSPVNGNGPFVNGLPDAAVQDLSFFERTGAQPLLLLRAALQARGVWEVDLRADLTPRTYLRVHPYDSRRITPTELPDGTQGIGAYGWEASPDVRVRPGPGADPVPVPLGPPWTRTTLPEDQPSWRLWVFQVALYDVDPLVRPDGHWTEAFDARITARRAALGLPDPDEAKIDAALWTAVVTPPHVYADPWDGTPTEADLHELVVDAHPFLTTAAGHVLAGPARIDVLVHHRHGHAVPAADVYVTVVSAQLPDTDSDWATMPVPWTADVVALLHNSGVPPAGWQQPGAPWLVGSGVVPTSTAEDPLCHSPSGPVDPRTPRAVTFDLNFTGGAADTAWVVVAVVHSAADPVSLTGTTLEELVRNNRHVAARTIET